MTPTQNALLVLEDGSVFRGTSIGSEGASIGEVVFNTAMSGYQEIITDPSYAQQIVTFTYPHIGNVGINTEDPEAGRSYVAGIVLREVPRRPSNWRSRQDLRESLRADGIVGIAGVDTRRLTRLLRDKGAQNGCIMVGGSVREAHSRARAFPGLKDMDLAKVVSCHEPYPWSEGCWPKYPRPQADGAHVVVYDYGVKRNILRMLVDRGCRVTVVPAQFSVEAVRGLAPDGVLLSNGPGDPAPCTYAIDAARAHMRDRLPLFGICLGHQILGIAVGGNTLKMKFGHHGANHPVLDLASGRVMITSQNHGFAVDEQSLPDHVEVTHRSLFDGSNQGIRVKDAPAFSFQGHPEASPGPHDVGPLFDQFVRMMREARR